MFWKVMTPSSMSDLAISLDGAKPIPTLLSLEFLMLIPKKSSDMLKFLN